MITYEQNFYDDFYISGDIREVGKKKFQILIVVLRIFLCQAFSIAGRKQGFDDDYYGNYRGTLFKEVVRICNYHKPKIILCENVKSLVIHDKGRTFKIICYAFKKNRL